MAQIILTDEERKELTYIPHNITDEILLTYCAFDEDDIKNITSNRYDIYSKIGYAVQLFYIRYLGWSYSNKTRIPSKVLDFIAKQLDIAPPIQWNLKAHYKRGNTIYNQFVEICNAYGYRQFDNLDIQKVYSVIASHADVVDNRVFIVKEIISFLRKKMIILPKISTIEKWVQEVCNQSEADINKLIYSQLRASQKASIRNAINNKGISTKTYTLHQLRIISGDISPTTFCEIADRIEYIDSVSPNIDLTSISPNKRKAIAKKILNRRLSSLTRSSEERIFPSVAIYLYETRKLLIDLAVEVNDSILHKEFRKGDKKAEKQIIDNRKEIFGSMSELLHAMDTVSYALHNKKNVLSELKRNDITIDVLDNIIKKGHDLNRSSNDNLDLIDSQYNQIRKYSPRLLDIIDITSNNKETDSLVIALDYLREMNLSTNQKLLSDPPLDHIEKKWMKYVCKNGIIDKRYYEMATLSSLKSAIRNNIVTVEGSDKYLSFDRDLIDYKLFNEATDKYETITAFSTFEEYIQDRQKRMDYMLEYLNDNITILDDLWIEKGNLHLSPLEAAVPQEAIDLSRRIFKSLVPEARLEEILLEVDKWTNFTQHFTHKNLKNQSARQEDKEKIFAALTALGTNVGLEKMSQSLEKYSYDQLYTMEQNCLDEDNITKAQGEIVRLLRSLWVSEYWGEGNTSSSDGRGMRNMVSSFNAEPNPRHGIDKGCTLYRFVCDKYYVFFTKVIRSAREFQHVIDGVLAHELMTGEPVIEHYTDTGGYSDPLFGLAHLLGFAYAPRIKNIASRDLYIFKDSIVGNNISNVKFKRIRKQNIESHYNDILRIAYSIKKGQVSGELVMRKLCNKTSELRKAVVEMGRIEKTIFLLQYYTSKELRRKIQIGLNKGEANNNLAKAVQFGREGKCMTRSLDKQQVQASTLSLLMDAICLWNAMYIQRSVEYIEANGAVDKSLLKHVSPQNYEHITFIGHYDFDLKQSLAENEFRKLKTE